MNSAVISLPDESEETQLPNAIIFPALKQKEKFKNVKVSSFVLTEDKGVN